MLMQFLIYSQTSKVQSLKFENGYIILCHDLLGLWLLIHSGIIVKSCWFDAKSLSESMISAPLRQRRQITLPVKKSTEFTRIILMSRRQISLIHLKLWRMTIWTHQPYLGKVVRWVGTGSTRNIESFDLTNDGNAQQALRTTICFNAKPRVNDIRP